MKPFKTAEEIFNTIPFLDIDKNGDYYNIPKTKVIEAMAEFASQFGYSANQMREYGNKSVVVAMVSRDEGERFSLPILPPSGDKLKENYIDLINYETRDLMGEARDRRINELKQKAGI
jgi:hypothetical protein